MKNFTFSGNWNPKINLNILTKLGSEEMFGSDEFISWIKELYADHKSNKVQVRISPAYNSNENPEEIQTKAINFILNNEKLIYSEIYTNLKNIIYPHYTEWYQEDMQMMAPLKKIQDMPKVLGLVDIRVNVIGSGELAWVEYNFRWKGEEEHGLSMLFEGAKFLKHSSDGEMSFDELLQKEKAKKYKYLFCRNMPSKMYYPKRNRKFYKPWELEKTRDYLLNLLNEGRLAEFESLVSSKGFNVNQKFPEDEYPLIEILIRNDYIEAAMILYKLGASDEGLMHFGWDLLKNLKRIQFVKDISGNIDERNRDNQTLLSRYLIVANDALVLNEKVYNKKMSFMEELEIFQRDKKTVFNQKMRIYKKHIKLLIKYGAVIENRKLYEKVLTYLKV